jgi:hypothetical protein
MNDLQAMDQKIRTQLEAVEQERRQTEEQLRERQAAQEQRARRFRFVADRILGQHIRPRLLSLASHFTNAVPLDAQETGRSRCVYLFQPTPRFPASGRLELAVHHDEEIEQVFLLFRFDLLPIPIPFVGQDHLVFPLYEIEEELAVKWIEEKLLQVVNVCLRLETGEQPEVITQAFRLSA